MTTLVHKREKVFELYSQNKGKLSTSVSSLKEIEWELSKNVYDTVEQELADAAIQINLAKDMVLELTEKHDSIEEGLMLYHHEKMQEINRQLANFWKVTYKGGDIESIQIKSDMEKDSKKTTSRSYNYRVVLNTYDGA